jgi:hypothetical protein
MFTRDGPGQLANGRCRTTELAVAYHQRWEAELVFDELKTHQRGAGMILRSRKPELVEQEIWGLLLTHYGIRHLTRIPDPARGHGRVPRDDGSRVR